METPRIDDLVWAILERGGEAAREALTGSCDRRRGHDAATDATSHGCRLLSPREIGQTCIQPGTWVTVGEFATNGARTLIEYQLSTGLTRERSVVESLNE